MDKIRKTDYFEWRLKIEEMLHAETKANSSRFMLQLIDKDLEIQQLKKSLFKYQARQLDEEIALKKKEYEYIKKSLEDKLGYSLNGCVIDEVTFEIKKMENDSKLKS